MEKEIWNLKSQMEQPTVSDQLLHFFIHLTARENGTFFQLNRSIKMYELT